MDNVDLIDKARVAFNAKYHTNLTYTEYKANFLPQISQPKKAESKKVPMRVKKDIAIETQFANIVLGSFKKLLKLSNDYKRDLNECLHEYAGVMCMIYHKVYDKGNKK